MLSIRDGALFSLKRINSTNINSIGSFFVKKAAKSQQDLLAQEDRGLIKGKNELSRLFKIDIVGKGRSFMSGL